MFNTSISLDTLNSWGHGNMIDVLGIEFIDVQPDFIKAKMPVDSRTKQPYGLLHGGASVVLAETLGSIAASLAVADPTTQRGVGVEINANHMKSVKEGFVIGTCTALKIGKTLHVYDIKIHDESGNLVCVSRLTVAILSY
ncbi:MAG: hotdog fold thioesterase [Cytophagia bacterium]|jgi:1,4-dihydroxy-2-naphthoyl-CoA hydrolase|nr:hotdog fold thioesterase [Cytophagia bacterium]